MGDPFKVQEKLFEVCAAGTLVTVRVDVTPGNICVTGAATNVTTGSAFTFRRAAAEVTDPQEATVTTARYLFRSIEVVTPVSDNVAEVAPDILLYVEPPSVLTCH